MDFVTQDPPPHNWQRRTPNEVLDELARRQPSQRLIIAIDGGSASGKTTLAQRLATAHPQTGIVSTDDLAWNHSAFDWDDLLLEHIIRPYREGRAITYRPPGWQRNDRPGALHIPERTELLIIEGVGACRHNLAPHADLTIWTHTTADIAAHRTQHRINTGECTQVLHDSWMTEEAPFLTNDRPWERCDLIVAGTAQLPDGPANEVLVASPSPHWPRESQSSDEGERPPSRVDARNVD